MTTTNPTIVRSDGTTTCCNAYTSVFIDDGMEYCKACYEDVQGYEPRTPPTNTHQLPPVTLGFAITGNLAVERDGTEVATGNVTVNPGTYAVEEYQPVDNAAYVTEAEVLLRLAPGVYAWCNADDVRDATATEVQP